MKHATNMTDRQIPFITQLRTLPRLSCKERAILFF